jgi:hypothetical protein
VDGSLAIAAILHIIGGLVYDVDVLDLTGHN